MICPLCFGRRRLMWIFQASTPCSYCNGTGVIHCCEGDQEQPDPNREETVYYSDEE